MPSFVDAIPLCDDQNPCYCPVDASTFIQTLRRRPFSHGSSEHELRASFTSKLLQKSVDEELLDASHDSFSPYDHSLRSTIKETYAAHPWKRDDRNIQSPSLFTSTHTHLAIPSLRRCSPKRNWSHLSPGNVTFSNLREANKRGRSDDIANHDSFELSGKADKLKLSCSDYFFSPTEYVIPSSASISHDTQELVKRIQDLEAELYGPRIGPETPDSLNILLEHLDHLLPGIRLQHRLGSTDGLSHQAIVDLLALHGHLSDRILDVFRTSEIVTLDLSASIADQSGLNLAGRDLLKAVDDVPIHDFDMTYIHHLPRLSVLSLCNTGLSNEAISHLLSLKWSLKELYIDSNPRINDDAIASLLSLIKLTYLSIVGTNIGIPGLRRLAADISETGRCLYIDAPDSCYEYTDNLNKCYVVDIRRPLIVDPSACVHLSLEALKRNLSQHAKWNSNISVTGSKAEMATRLEGILTTRRLDLLVVKLLFEGGGMTKEGEDEDE